MEQELYIRKTHGITCECVCFTTNDLRINKNSIKEISNFIALKFIYKAYASNALEYLIWYTKQSRVFEGYFATKDGTV